MASGAMTQPILPNALFWSPTPPRQESPAASRASCSANAMECSMPVGSPLMQKHKIVGEDVVDAFGGTFNGQYALQSKLGDGMTACVYVATDLASGARYACKVAERRHHKFNWSRVVSVLQHEAELLHSIEGHDRIVRLERMFQGANEMVIVLELVPGGDCQQLLHRHGCLSEQAVQPMMFQLQAALGYLHERSVIHRDVKLENLLCNTQVWPPSIKLCDFGHACSTADALNDYCFYGTPGYAAPEVVKGPTWSPAADVWAVGVVMFALLANALPFEQGSRHSQPPDMSGRAWWEVSVDAKLLLVSLLEPVLNDRVTLANVRRSPWMQRHANAGANRMLGRRGYSCAMLSDASADSRMRRRLSNESHSFTSLRHLQPGTQQSPVATTAVTTVSELVQASPAPAASSLGLAAQAMQTLASAQGATPLGAVLPVASSALGSSALGSPPLGSSFTSSRSSPLSRRAKDAIPIVPETVPISEALDEGREPEQAPGRSAGAGLQHAASYQGGLSTCVEASSHSAVPSALMASQDLLMTAHTHGMGRRQASYCSMRSGSIASSAAAGGELGRGSGAPLQAHHARSMSCSQLDQLAQQGSSGSSHQERLMKMRDAMRDIRIQGLRQSAAFASNIRKR